MSEAWKMVDERSPFGIMCDDKVVAYAFDRKDATAIAALPDLIDQVLLFKKTIEYQIKRDMQDGDDEGARLKTVTMNLVNDVLRKAGAS